MKKQIISLLLLLCSGLTYGQIFYEINPMEYDIVVDSPVFKEGAVIELNQDLEVTDFRESRGEIKAIDGEFDAFKLCGFWVPQLYKRGERSKKTKTLAFEVEMASMEMSKKVQENKLTENEYKDFIKLTAKYSAAVKAEAKIRSINTKGEKQKYKVKKVKRYARQQELIFQNGFSVELESLNTEDKYQHISEITCFSHVVFDLALSTEQTDKFYNSNSEKEAYYYLDSIVNVGPKDIKELMGDTFSVVD